MFSIGAVCNSIENYTIDAASFSKVFLGYIGRLFLVVLSAMQPPLLQLTRVSPGLPYRELFLLIVLPKCVVESTMSNNSVSISHEAGIGLALFVNWTWLCCIFQNGITQTACATPIFSRGSLTIGKYLGPTVPRAHGAQDPRRHEHNNNYCRRNVPEIQLATRFGIFSPWYLHIILHLIPQCVSSIMHRHPR